MEIDRRENERKEKKSLINGRKADGEGKRELNKWEKGRVGEKGRIE